MIPAPHFAMFLHRLMATGEGTIQETHTRTNSTHTLCTLEPGIERTLDFTFQGGGLLDHVQGIHRFLRERRLSLLCTRCRQVT